jgi:hypothetical protein
VAGGQVAVVSSALPQTKSVSVASTQLVIPQCVYTALLSVRTVYDGVVKFGIARSPVGLYEVVDKSGEAASMYTIDSLPHGRYLLPGGFGCVVSRETVVAVLEAVWVSTKRPSERGWCYMRVTPPAVRGHVATALGEMPYVSQLVRVCPDVYTWSTRQAKVHSVVDGTTGAMYYHVATYGTLPRGLSLDVRIGGGPSKTPHLDEVGSRLEQTLLRRMQMPQPSVKPLPAAPVSHARSFSDTDLGSTIRREATPVFSLEFGVMHEAKTLWTDFSDPLAREWSERFGHGPPVGATVLEALAKASPDDLPPLPMAEGGRLLAIPASKNPLGATVAGWREVDCPVPGWQLERIKPPKAEEFVVVPPAKKAICRYEVSAKQPYMVNGLVMPVHRCAFWVEGSFLVQRFDRGVKMWRVWHVGGGAAALGVQVMALHIMYDVPAIMQSRYERERVLCAHLKSRDDARGEAKYEAVCLAEPGDWLVHVYVADVVGSEAALLIVRAPALSQVKVHGVVLTAVAGQVSCVVDIGCLAVEYCLGISSRGAGRDVCFEIRRQVVPGLKQPRVQGVRSVRAIEAG